MSKSSPVRSSGPAGLPGRRKRAVLGVVVSLSFVAALAGCSTPSNTPEAYDATVESNFMDGCTATAPPAKTGETGESLGQGASDKYCQCAYNWFVNNVPYSDAAPSGDATTTTGPAAFADFNFKSINADLADDPTSLPESIKSGISDACGSSDKPGTPEPTTPTTAGAEEDPDNSSTTTSTPG